jgi:ABC-type oligopeptide transport system ATPase subunit
VRRSCWWVSRFRLARSKAEARRKIEEALVAVGLRPEETLGRYPHQLSGGQRQRLTVARASLLQPRLIIADEPVSMVDASLRATILESLKKLHTDFAISFLYITHDLTTAYQISSHIIVLYRGAVAEVGDCAARGAGLSIRGPLPSGDAHLR